MLDFKQAFASFHADLEQLTGLLTQWSQIPD